MERTVRADGSVELADANCSFTYTRLAPGTLLVEIRGDDTGQFGSAALDELTAEYQRFGMPLNVFVDTRKAVGPSTEVMELWSAWMAANRGVVRRLMVLVAPQAKLMHLTISVAKHLSRTGDLLHICQDMNEFVAAMRRSVPEAAV